MKRQRRIKRRALVLTAMAAVCWAAGEAGASHNIIVGKNVSADGSVLVGFTEEMGPSTMVNWRKVPRRSFPEGATVTLTRGAKIPQVRETFAYLWSECPGASNCDAVFNEWGVFCRGQRTYYRIKKRDLSAEVVNGGVSYMIWRLVAERARSARHAVEVAAEIIARVGYTNNQSLLFADAGEVWLMQIANGNKWLARRCPDEAVTVLESVGFYIGPYDPNDREKWIASPGLIETAVKLGWYDPKAGKPFRFGEVYCGSERADPNKDGRRYALSLVAGRKVEKDPDGWFPMAVRPPRRLGVKDLLPMIRDHAHWICNPSRISGGVVQLRANMPPAIGAVTWLALGEPCSSALVPWYAGTMSVPREWAQPGNLDKLMGLGHHFRVAPYREASYAQHAFWRVRNLVNADRDRRLPIARRTLDAMEDKLLADQPAVEAEALRLHAADPAAAARYLTARTHKAAAAAIDTAERLAKQLDSPPTTPTRPSARD